MALLYSLLFAPVSDKLVFLLAVERQNSANSPKTLQNGMRCGQTTKNTTRQ